jgi:hypothetical protein
LGALVLAETLPPQFTPRRKYYAIKTIWFREEIHKRGIKLLKIDTKEQLGDIFTKGLAQPAFEYLCSKFLVGDLSFLLLFVTSSRGSVDIGSVDLSQVHHFTVSLFSCTMGEECWLCFISDDHQVTDMPLLLTGCLDT